MILFAAGVCIFCFLIYSVLMLRNRFYKSQLGQLKRQVQELSVQKEKTLLAMQIAQTRQAVPTASLATIFVNMPKWSLILSELAQKLPDQMWLEQIRSSNIGDLVEKKKVEISGRSVSHAAVAQFVKQIEDSENFSNTLLQNTQKDNSGYKFVISTEADFPKAEW